MRPIIYHILTLALTLTLLPPPTRLSALAVPSLALRVAQAGVVTVTDVQLAQAGWPTPLPRERVTLSRRGQVLPLADTGSGFAFIALPSESRWTSEAVYWFSVGVSPGPRAALPARLPTPLSWGPDTLYERHQPTARGDA